MVKHRGSLHVPVAARACEDSRRAPDDIQSGRSLGLSVVLLSSELYFFRGPLAASKTRGLRKRKENDIVYRASAVAVLACRLRFVLFFRVGNRVLPRVANPLARWEFSWRQQRAW